MNTTRSAPLLAVTALVAPTAALACGPSGHELGLFLGVVGLFVVGFHVLEGVAVRAALAIFHGAHPPAVKALGLVLPLPFLGLGITAGVAMCFDVPPFGMVLLLVQLAFLLPLLRGLLFRPRGVVAL